MVPQELIASLPTFSVRPTQVSMGCVAQTGKNNHWRMLSNYPLMSETSIEVVTVSWAELRVCAGQMHAVALLERYQTIPPAWRPFHMYFFGTKWVDSKGMTRIARLKYRRFLGWRLDWGILGTRLDPEKVRAVVIQQQKRFVAA